MKAAFNRSVSWPSIVRAAAEFAIKFPSETRRGQSGRHEISHLANRSDSVNRFPCFDRWPSVGHRVSSAAIELNSSAAAILPG